MAVIAVKPALIVWAREHRGLTRSEAAVKLSIPEPDLLALEQGKKPLNLTQFKKISDRLRVPRATLLRQTPPNIPPMPTDFRTIDGRRPRIDFDTRIAISYAQTINANILELVEAGAAPPTPVLARVSLTENASEAGERERERLGISPATQFAWPFKDAANNWRSVIENLGVFVLLQKFDLEDCRGFTTYENPNSPIIVLNKNEPHEPARIFTLVHEYCHLLLRQPGLSDHNDRNPVEAFCNRFAAGFLMPRAALRAALPTWPNQPIEWEFEDIRNWARRFKVSQQAFALRLEELNLAPAGYYARFVASQQEITLREQSGGDHVATQMSEMGARYLQTVMSATDAGQIGQVEATDMLQLSPQHFDRVREQVARRFSRIGAIPSVVSH
ncbi:XRE family transcriptional regulator [Methylobacterium sp. J-030]|uniref:XRE family transcriptional regulator n=1 Tax=Methylobacterium sp. J-030 TaxID=2836627 RepID=UPI001FBAB2AC|nr:XRE family transcriptional regulator [Methylobacterium sp. J-030]MCJ2069347.1 XRE family transcriptional regulator [Methylobacterium sp. J-030]